MNRVLAIAFAALFLMGFLARQYGAFDPNAAGRADTASAVPTQKAATRSGWTADVFSIARDSSGQFHLEALVNGQEARFLVDTGADVVALTVDDAERLGINVDASQFQEVGRSASGTAYGMPVMLERIEVAGTELLGVQALVIDGLGENLLGQTVLGRLEKVELRGNRMMIHRK